jgi:hypothetical protein
MEEQFLHHVSRQDASITRRRYILLAYYALVADTDS